MNTSLQSNQEGEENQPPDGRPKTISSQRGIFSLKAKKRKKTDDVLGPRIIRSSSGKSKVCTGRGCRDRRVRLAPKTAIQFYDVQERLGFDRPSKAIDWLMAEAKAAIDALQPPPAASQPPESFGFFMNNNSEFQVYSDIPDDSFEWIYGNSPPPVLGNNHNIHDEFSPREPLQSSFSRISNYNPIGIEDFAPGENHEIDNIQFSSASFLQYEE